MVVGPVGGAQRQKSKNSSHEGPGVGACAKGTKNTIDRVENAGLAERVLVLGSRVTPVVTALRAANAVVGVSLIRLLRGGS
jgi:hypothetical protein